MNLCANLFILYYILQHCFGESTNFSNDNVKKLEPKHLWNETTLDKLRKDLFANYDKYSRPEERHNVIDVRIGMAITHLETNELESSITINSWIRLVWNDKKLRWNESDYGDINIARIANHEVWQPDMFLYNGFSGSQSLLNYKNPHVLVYPTGEVLFVPPIQLKAICKFNFRYWPFDTQHCMLKIGSWVYHQKELNLTLYNSSPNIDLESTKPSTAWNLGKRSIEIVSKYYACCPDPYPYARINITLHRKSDSYAAIIVTPVIVLSIFIMVQFWLAPASHERVLLNGITAIILVMYLTYFNGHAFGIGFNTPLVVMFYAMNLLLICVSMAATCFGAVLAQMKQTRYLPWLLNKHLNGKLGKFLLLDYQLGNGFAAVQSKMLQNEKDNQITKNESNNKDKWIFAIAINRILFIIYCVIYLIIATVYIC